MACFMEQSSDFVRIHLFYINTLYVWSVYICKLWLIMAWFMMFTDGARPGQQWSQLHLGALPPRPVSGQERQEETQPQGFPPVSNL